MPRAACATLQLARFGRLHEAGPLAAVDGALFLGAAADTRAAGTAPDSGQAYVFAVLGLHRSPDDGRAVQADPLAVAPWLGTANERCSLLLEAVRHRGTANYLGEPGPFVVDAAAALSDDEPCLVLTTSGWQAGTAATDPRVQSFGGGVMAVRMGMTAVPGLLSQQSFFFPGGIATDPMTVTFWRSKGALAAWAYGPGTHRAQIERDAHLHLSDRTSFTRFRVVAGDGHWDGWRGSGPAG